MFSETPTWAASLGADTLLFDLASSHMARDRRRRRASGCRVAAPAAVERWRGHLARRLVRLRPATGEHLSHSHPSGHLTPISRLTRPHSPSAYFWQGVGLSISPRPACASCCPSCSPSRPRRLPPWHNMAEDVSPVIMKRVGEHYRLFDAILGFPHIRLAFRLLF